jgi:hypothetical protein
MSSASLVKQGCVCCTDSTPPPGGGHTDVEVCTSRYCSIPNQYRAETSITDHVFATVTSHYDVPAELVLSLCADPIVEDDVVIADYASEPFLVDFTVTNPPIVDKQRWWAIYYFSVAIACTEACGLTTFDVSAGFDAAFDTSWSLLPYEQPARDMPVVYCPSSVVGSVDTPSLPACVGSTYLLSQVFTRSETGTEVGTFPPCDYVVTLTPV